MKKIINKLKKGKYINNYEFLDIAMFFNVKVNMHTQLFIINKVRKVNNKYIIWNSPNPSKCLFNIYKQVLDKINEI